MEDIKNYEFEHQAMATQFRLHIVDALEEDAKTAAYQCFQCIDALELVLSRFVPDSDISRMNRMKSGDELMLDIETWEVLRETIAIQQQTNGAFDVGVAEYMDIFRAAKQGILTDFEVTNALKLAFKEAQNTRIFIDPKTPKAYCIEQGMKFDLGAIGKGYAIDKISVLLDEMNIQNYAINAGNSSILVKGKSKNTPFWSYPISTSSEEQTLELQNISVSASGTFFQGDHIFDPRMGQNKFDAKYNRVWVASESTLLSDAYATASFLLEKEQLETLLENEPRIAWIALSENDKIQFIEQKNVTLTRTDV